MFGVEGDRPPSGGNRERRRSADCGAVGQMEVGNVEMTVHQESAKPGQPADIQVVSGSEPMHGDAPGFERPDQRILGIEYEGHLVFECAAVTVGSDVYE